MTLQKIFISIVKMETSVCIRWWNVLGILAYYYKTKRYCDDLGLSCSSLLWHCNLTVFHHLWKTYTALIFLKFGIELGIIQRVSEYEHFPRFCTLHSWLLSYNDSWQRGGVKQLQIPFISISLYTLVECSELLCITQLMPCGQYIFLPITY